MRFFGKDISKIYIFDFLPELNMSGDLAEFCSKCAQTQVKTPADESDFFSMLTSIAAEDHFGGIILQLMAHGSPDKLRFGKNAAFALEWHQLVIPLTAINESSGDNLILNSSITCYSDPLAQLKLAHPKMFHAALYSISDRSAQAITQNIFIYKECLNTDNTLAAINQVNDTIYDTQDDFIRPYGYIGH